MSINPLLKLILSKETKNKKQTQTNLFWVGLTHGKSAPSDWEKKLVLYGSLSSRPTWLLANTCPVVHMQVLSEPSTK